MLIFRSEEHLQNWCDARTLLRGATLTVDNVWALSQRWYADRLDPDFSGRTPAEVAQIFAELNLTGPFWQF